MLLNDLKWASQTGYAIWDVIFKVKDNCIPSSAQAEPLRESFPKIKNWRRYTGLSAVYIGLMNADEMILGATMWSIDRPPV